MCQRRSRKGDDVLDVLIERDRIDEVKTGATSSTSVIATVKVVLDVGTRGPHSQVTAVRGLVVNCPCVGNRDNSS